MTVIKSPFFNSLDFYLFFALVIGFKSLNYNWGLDMLTKKIMAIYIGQPKTLGHWNGDQNFITIFNNPKNFFFFLFFATLGTWFWLLNYDQALEILTKKSWLLKWWLKCFSPVFNSPIYFILFLFFLLH